jgi:23S rRNA (adenine2503-C2)-methyltransferase
MNHKLFIVNLIPLNPVNDFQAPNNQTIIKFKHILDRNHINYTQRYSFGQEINAACGQLSGRT